MPQTIKRKKEISEEEIMEMIACEQFSEFEDSEEDIINEDEEENNNEDNNNDSPTLLRNILSYLIKGKKWKEVDKYYNNRFVCK